MELFIATTGCSDPTIASFYLSRADNDVSRAVNFYFDAPDARRQGATAGEGTAAADGNNGNGKNSRRSSLKRQRAGHEGGGKPQQEQEKQQRLTLFDHSRGLLTGGSSCGGISSVGAGGRGSNISIRSINLKNGGKQHEPSATSTGTERSHEYSAVVAPAPATEWTEIAEHCIRQGLLFEDSSFPPVPASLDGRAGKGGSAATSRNGDPKDEGDEEHASCKCGVPAKVVTVSKAGRNQGRLFYGCVTRECDFFRWADSDAPHTRQALSLVWRRFTHPRFTLSGSAASSSAAAVTATDAAGAGLATTTGAGSGGGSISAGRARRSGFKPEDIRQGAVGDCWFLAGLAVISERPDLIARVVGSNGPLADALGCYEVNLFKDGRWESVVVDSWLPCKDPAKLKGKEKGLDHLPAFAKPGTNNQIWPCIVEKAFAKQHGSYDAISGGHVCDAFEALTGAPTETVMLDSDDSEGNWAKLLSFNQAGFPMGCATAWDPSRGLRDVGLVSTHAYSVLKVKELPPGMRGAHQPKICDWAELGSAAAAAEEGRRRDGEGWGWGHQQQPLRLVRVRNPWGKREWTGAWSQGSDKWSDSVRAELGWSEMNDGTFWMTWQDFMTRFQLVDVCKARRGWSHASVAAQAVAPGSSSSFRIRPPPRQPPPPTTGTAHCGANGSRAGMPATATSPATAIATPSAGRSPPTLATAKSPPPPPTTTPPPPPPPPPPLSTTTPTTPPPTRTTAATTGPSSTATPKIWAYVTVVQPTKRGRKDSYWYKALGLLVTEMGAGSGGNAGACGSGTKASGGGTLVAASLGGARRCLSCEVFLESGKVYMASVVRLDGDGAGGGNGGASASTRIGGYPRGGLRGFRVTVYSAHPVQIVPGERRPSAPGFFPVGPSLHQALSQRWLEEERSGGGGGDSGGAEENLPQFLSLGAEAALFVLPVGGSAVFFIVLNASSAAGIILGLSITCLEGASAFGPPATSSTAWPSPSPLSPSPDRGSTHVLCACPPASQKIAMVLARTADHGSFSHEFRYRASSTAASARTTAAAGRSTSRKGSSGGGASGLSLANDGGRGDTPGFGGTHGGGVGGGVFSAQGLLAGAVGLVRRARGAGAIMTGFGGEVEGRGGGTVTGGDGDVGSAAVATRRDH